MPQSRTAKATAASAIAARNRRFARYAEEMNQHGWTVLPPVEPTDRPEICLRDFGNHPYCSCRRCLTATASA